MSAEDLFASTFDAVVLDTMARERGVHPDDVAALARWAPLGLTSLCWRNSVLEDWHAGPDSAISDAQMLRANVATTRLFADGLRRWLDESEIVLGACRADVAEADPEHLYAVLDETVLDVVDPDRRLPHGATVRDVGGEETDALRQHAIAQVYALTEQADAHGCDLVLLWLAVRGLWTCRHWWGTESWPPRVDLWLSHIDNPDHSFWASTGPPTETPDRAEDRQWLRRTLLSAPDDLPDEVAAWCIANGLGYVDPEA